MVAMRDGVRLATDLYLPDSAGPFPVILERTPYGRNLPSRSEITAGDRTPASRAALAAYFTAHGYAVAFQDTRGRYGSEGRFVKYLADGEDGADTCAWLRAQPWCDGRICTMGLSYAAHTQAALGCLDPPGLVAQVLDCGGFANAWKSGIRQSGAFELKQATWAHKNAAVSPEAEADPVMRAALEAEDLRDWFTRMPWKPGHSPLRHHPDYEAYLFEQWTHGADDGFWHQLGVRAEAWHDRYSRAACVHMSSWWDPYALSATANFTGLRGRGPQRLILGPWTHGDRSDRVFGDVDFGAEAPIDSWAGDWRAYRLRFFDHVVKGAPLAEPRCACSSWAAAAGGGRPRAISTTAASGSRRPTGRCRALRSCPTTCTGTDASIPAVPASDAAPLSYDFDPRRPGPDDRRRLLQPGAAGARRPSRSDRGVRVLRLHATLPAAGVAPRHPGVPDAAAHREAADRRPGHGRAVRRHRRAGYGLHRQADRCPSPLGRLSGRIRDAANGRHPAPALRRGPGRPETARAPARWCARPSRCSRPRTCSCRGIGCGSISPRATSPSSTSTRTPSGLKGGRD